MRLWSLHASYLDARGLVALWREGLLAQKVLAGLTSGYRHHPQLERFCATDDPLAAIATYLEAVALEADRRGYKFDRSRLQPDRTMDTLTVNEGQLIYEFEHLLTKLKHRSPEIYELFKKTERPEPHPMFRVKRGGIENWEKLN